MDIRHAAGCIAVVAVLGALPPTGLMGQGPPSIAMISACDFANGVVIAPCRIAYRAFGTLNSQRSNVVLVPTWLQGRSEEWPAYGLLGPEGIIDTTAFYTIVVDALGNGHSQSPSNTDAAHVRGFEALTIADMVRSQHRLLTEHFSISRLHAVVGASMGGMQAFEWAVRFPAFVDRIVPIIGSPRIDAYDMLLWTSLRTTIDNGQRGGLSALDIWRQLQRIQALAARTPRGVNQVTPDSMTRQVAASAEEVAKSWSLEDYRAQLGAMMRHDVSVDHGRSLDAAARRITARMLLVYSWDDHMVTADAGAAFGRMIRADSTVIASPCGHLMIFCETPRVGASIRQFLAR